MKISRSAVHSRSAPEDCGRRPRGENRDVIARRLDLPLLPLDRQNMRSAQWILLGPYRRSRGPAVRAVPKKVWGSCPCEFEGSVPGAVALIRNDFQCFHQKPIVVFSAACDAQESFAILKRLAAIVPDQYPSIIQKF